MKKNCHLKKQKSYELELNEKFQAIGIRIQSMKKTEDTDIGPDSFIYRWLGFVTHIAQARFNKTGIPTSGKDVLERMCKVCVDCERLGTTSIGPYIEVVE